MILYIEVASTYADVEWPQHGSGHALAALMCTSAQSDLSLVKVHALLADIGARQQLRA